MENKSVKAIRHLCVDMVERASSGHPGMPLGAAPIMYALWKDHIRVNPKEPTWINRDRFVLSSGHASSLLYSVLHLTGYDVTIEDLQKFRQMGSRTPGHPEYGVTEGVDATTGPLGQGVAMGVGMALSESILHEKFDNIIDHYTYVLCGDGDMMEGVASEASSFAGHNKLNKLIMIYDSNRVTLDGKLDLSFSEDVGKRYESYGWNVIYVEDGMDARKVSEAIAEAKKEKQAPTLIIANTTIGYGVEGKEGTNKVHGSPIGKESKEQLKEFDNWPYDDFEVPQEVYEDLNKQVLGDKLYSEWQKELSYLKKKDESKYNQLMDIIERKNLKSVDVDFGNDSIATRSASSLVINELANLNHHFMGGSADLSSSNKTYITDAGDYSFKNRNGKNIWYGVREFAMASIMNGMILHSGIRNYVSTFLVFSDYLKPAMRLSALMGLPAIYVFTHDSIAVGEDGATHEPIEQTMSLRLIPNSYVFRAADAKETLSIWNYVGSLTDKPASILLSRQNLSVLNISQEEVDKGVARGAYLVKKHDNPTGIIIATGSEVELALNVSEELEKEGHNINVVSMPCMELFLEQDQEYINSVIQPSLESRLVLEMGTEIGWDRFVKKPDQIYGINSFGESAPADDVLKHFGFTVEEVCKYYLEVN